MRQKQILKNGLVCAGEHLECENYAADKQTLLRVVNLKAGDYYFRDKTEHSTLVFLLSGELELSMGYTINQKVVGGQMYLIPAGESYCSKTKTDTTVFYSLFDFFPFELTFFELSSGVNTTSSDDGSTYRLPSFISSIGISEALSLAKARS